MYFNKQLNNKRIAKNTLILYFRMLFTMVVQLYASRLVLQALGIEDYGIYNVVGGVVAVFVFFNAAMTTSTQRFITFEIGRGDFKQLRTVFSTSIIIHVLIALIVIILAESVGLWFLHNKMVVADNRMNAAIWVFQLSILTTVISIMSFPYNALIVAYEKMSAFAYISIAEVSLMLVAVYLLLFCNSDKLIVFTMLMAIIRLLVWIIYIVYCNKMFPESRFFFPKNKRLFNEMILFAGWNLWGNLAFVLFTQGLNMLLNVFFGTAVNAARAVAVQVQGAIQQFSGNFQMAINPQIMKTYASGNLEDMHKLIFRSSRFTFLLLYILSFPIILETPTVLKIWLTTVPEHTIIFLRIMLVTMVVDSSSGSLMVAASATGHVKRYQSVVGGILLLIVPIAYIVLKCGAPPCSVFVVHFCVCCIAYLARLFIVKSLIDLHIKMFFKEVVFRCLKVVVVTSIMPVLIKNIVEQNLLNSFLLILFSFCWVIVGCYYLGLDQEELSFIHSKIPFLNRLCRGKRS